MVKKIAFWVRLAGWSGLVSGSSVLMLYQYSHSSLFLINLITIVILVVLVFVSILPTIFLGIGYFIERKRNQ